MTGSTISHYEILEKLGEGGMGVVYKARDTRLDRLIAIKILPADSFADSDRRRRFVREAKSASALNHPNIVTIYDIDSVGASYFIAMEYIAGRSLDDMITRKGMRLADALRLAVQIADALAAAHRAGIVHRDLKPANVMVTAKGIVKVVDFGLAKLIESNVLPAQEVTQSMAKPSDDSLTERGYIVGTLAYMSPEQAESQPVDGRSDVFSMGCLLYEMLTGKRAFQRESKIRTLSAILSEEPQRMSEIVEDLPAELERVVSRCLRKERERRFQHMDDLKIALEELKEESESGQLTIRSQAKARHRSRISKIAPLALVFFALLITVAVFLLRPKEPVRPSLSHPIAVTTYRGTEENATLSPDGRQVAFSGNVNDPGNFDLYVKLIGADPLFRLTQNPDPDQHPVWSPDGRWIAFSRYANPNKLLLISPLGGFERSLAEADDITPQTWTPDSKYILAIKGLLDSGKAELVAISAESGQSKRLLKDVGTLAALSHDGRRIVLTRGPALAPRLYVASVSSGLQIGPERELNTVKGVQLGGCTWTADDTNLVCSVRQKSSIPPSLCRIDPADALSIEVIPFTEGAWDPVIASSGDRLVYDVAKVERDVWQVNNGLQVRSKPAPVPTRFASWTKSDLVPRYSPDGQRLAFLSIRSGPVEICISSADGSNMQTLAALPDIDWSPPTWSPDGKSLVFVRDHELYTVDVGSGVATHLASDAPEKASDPIYSYEGKSIYFASDRTGRSEIWKIPVQGGAAVQITRDGGSKPLQSPDGKFFVFVKPGSGKYDVIGARKGSPEHSLLTADGRFGRVPNLAFAHGALFYMIFAKPDLPMAIDRLDLSTGRSSRVNTLTTPQRFSGGDFTASPDGKTFLYWAIDFSDDLMQIEHFR